MQSKTFLEVLFDGMGTLNAPHGGCRVAPMLNSWVHLARHVMQCSACYQTRRHPKQESGRCVLLLKVALHNGMLTDKHALGPFN